MGVNGRPRHTARLYYQVDEAGKWMHCKGDGCTQRYVATNAPGRLGVHLADCKYVSSDMRVMFKGDGSVALARKRPLPIAAAADSGTPEVLHLTVDSGPPPAKEGALPGVAMYPPARKSKKSKTVDLLTKQENEAKKTVDELFAKVFVRFGYAFDNIDKGPWRELVKTLNVAPRGYVPPTRKVLAGRLCEDLYVKCKLDCYNLMLETMEQRGCTVATDHATVLMEDLNNFVAVFFFVSRKFGNIWRYSILGQNGLPPDVPEFSADHVAKILLSDYGADQVHSLMEPPNIFSTQ